MSRSTADQRGRSVLCLVFRDGDEEIARMRLVGPVHGRSAIGACPYYVDPDASEGVLTVRDEAGIDGRSPFQLYMGHDADITPVLLLEDIRYEVELSSDHRLQRVFPFLMDNSERIALKKSFFSAEDRQLFDLSFVSYVGRGEFDIVHDGRTFRIPFEVRSRKIGYRTEYPQMLADITEFSTSILMQMKSPLYRYYGMSHERSGSRYEDFLVLDHVFSNMHLTDLYEYVRNNRRYATVVRHENVPVEIAGAIDELDFQSMLRGDGLMPMDGGPVLGSYIPARVDEIRYEDDFDTPENRLVKDLVLTVQQMSHMLLADSDDDDVSDYISDRLKRMCRESDVMASDEWLQDVNGLTMVPFESTVLQQAHGYSELFRIYQMLGMGAMFQQKDMDGLLKGHGSRVSEVYEYWCYTRLYRCLYQMSSDKPEFPAERNNGSWCLTIKNDVGVDFLIPVEDRELNVTLYYNKGFSPGLERFRSYSVGLRPDYTLLIKAPGESTYLINFDAKYKLKPLELDDSEFDPKDEASECWRADLYKMHTYRDALLYSYGSYVLYPGRTNKVFVKPGADDEWTHRDDNIIPSIGSIRLVPGSDEDPELLALLEKVFHRIAGCGEGTEYIDVF